MFRNHRNIKTQTREPIGEAQHLFPLPALEPQSQAAEAAKVSKITHNSQSPVTKYQWTTNRAKDECKFSIMAIVSLKTRSCVTCRQRRLGRTLAFTIQRLGLASNIVSSWRKLSNCWPRYYQWTQDSILFKTAALVEEAGRIAGVERSPNCATRD